VAARQLLIHTQACVFFGGMQINMQIEFDSAERDATLADRGLDFAQDRSRRGGVIARSRAPAARCVCQRFQAVAACDRLLTDLLDLR
jgi:hypothetical protein